MLREARPGQQHYGAVSIWQRRRASNRTIKPLHRLGCVAMLLAVLQGGLRWTQAVAEEQAGRQVLGDTEVAWDTRDASAWVKDSHYRRVSYDTGIG